MVIALSMALKLNWKVTKLVTTTDLPSSGRVWWKIHLFQRQFSPRIQRLEEEKFIYPDIQQGQGLDFLFFLRNL